MTDENRFQLKSEKQKPATDDKQKMSNFADAFGRMNIFVFFLPICEFLCHTFGTLATDLQIEKFKKMKNKFAVAIGARIFLIYGVHLCHQP